jgi:STE24 endopeptidase
MLFQMILTPFEAVFKLAMNALSRRFEWQADRFAFELGHSPSDEKSSSAETKTRDEKKDEDDIGARLARALITLHVENLSTVWVDWLCVLSVIPVLDIICSLVVP